MREGGQYRTDVSEISGEEYAGCVAEEIAKSAASGAVVAGCVTAGSFASQTFAMGCAVACLPLAVICGALLVWRVQQVWLRTVLSD